jgi:hypothetical protein
LQPRKRAASAKAMPAIRCFLTTGFAMLVLIDPHKNERYITLHISSAKKLASLNGCNVPLKASL